MANFLVKVNWVNGKRECQQVLGGRRTDFFICLYGAEITSKVQIIVLFYSDEGWFNSVHQESDEGHWQDLALPPPLTLWPPSSRSAAWSFLATASRPYSGSLWLSPWRLLCKCCSCKLLPGPNWFLSAQPLWVCQSSLPHISLLPPTLHSSSSALSLGPTHGNFAFTLAPLPCPVSAAEALPWVRAHCSVAQER